MPKLTFALFFGNRGFFPGELIAGARRELAEAVVRSGHHCICMEEDATRLGAVETRAEGRQYAEFLQAHSGEYDGVILCLPNFGDENGAAAALQQANVPVLVQAYPDEIGLMDFAHRRDALCGKLAMCNVLRQCGIPYTLTKSMTVHPSDPAFQEDLRQFAGICRVVKHLRRLNIGAIGARTTAFKTVRIDEIAMQNAHVNVETMDLSLVFDRMEKVDAIQMAERCRRLSHLATVPERKLEPMARLSVVLDDLIAEYDLQAVAIRCWDEFQKVCGIAPCLVMSDLTERGIPASCELDVNNAVMMYAMQQASDRPVMLMDMNNNYGTEQNKCILFHCSAVPRSFFSGEMTVKEHLMFRKFYGAGSGVGVVSGKVMQDDVTIGSLKTEGGALFGFAAEGRLTDDAIEEAFFGCGTVLENGQTENILQYMCENGYRHHVAVAHGKWAGVVREALEKYLGYKMELL